MFETSCLFLSETTLKLYCKAVGLDYQDSMIHWKPLSEHLVKEFVEWGEWLDVAKQSNGFLKKTPSVLPEVKDLPPEVQQCVKDNIPFYQQLYEKRLKP